MELRKFIKVGLRWINVDDITMFDSQVIAVREWGVIHISDEQFKELESKLSKYLGD